MFGLAARKIPRKTFWKPLEWTCWTFQRQNVSLSSVLSFRWSFNSFSSAVFTDEMTNKCYNRVLTDFILQWWQWCFIIVIIDIDNILILSELKYRDWQLFNNINIEIINKNINNIQPLCTCWLVCYVFNLFICFLEFYSARGRCVTFQRKRVWNRHFTLEKRWGEGQLWFFLFSPNLNSSHWTRSSTSCSRWELGTSRRSRPPALNIEKKKPHVVTSVWKIRQRSVAKS